MMIENWVLILTVLFISVTKFLQYSAGLHDSWISRFTLGKTKTYKDYMVKLQEQKAIQEENHTISAQDNYAQWTKNNRKLDKLATELKELKGQIHEQIAQSKKALKSVKLMGLTLPFLALKLWKGKEIVYYLPSDKFFPHVFNGIWHQGWLFVAMYPLDFVLRKVNNYYDVSFIASKFTVFSGSLVGVSLGIWIWALTSVLGNVDFIINQLIINEPVQKPVIKAN